MPFWLNSTHGMYLYTCQSFKVILRCRYLCHDLAPAMRGQICLLLLSPQCSIRSGITSPTSPAPPRPGRPREVPELVCASCDSSSLPPESEASWIASAPHPS